MEYREFLESKQCRSRTVGFDPLWMPDFLFPFQGHLTEWAIRKGRAALFEDCGLGKGSPPDTPVLTPDGFVPIGDLEVGDRVIASDGKPYAVLGVFPKPVQDVYRVTFSDGSSLVVDSDHLHIVRTANDRGRGKAWRVASTRELLVCGNIRYGKGGKSRNYDIPVVEPVDFGPSVPMMVSPYAIGALLGDGCQSLGDRVGFSTDDPEVLGRVNRGLPAGTELRKKNGSKYDYRLVTGGKGGKLHPLRSFFRTMGMNGRLAHEKRIPPAYLYGSVEDRVELLRGLMDTDGYIMECGTSQFSSASRGLASDVRFLVRSLGGIPTSKRRARYLDGVRKRDSYTVTFSLATFNPFCLRRKAERWNPSPRDNGRWIDRIEHAGESETVCIAVDSPDSSYVTKSFIVTHNTPQSLVWCENVVRKANRPVLILTPLAVSRQFVREGDKFGVGVHNARDGSVVKGINVANYERIDRFDPDDFAGVTCDESSILKSFDGKMRRKITDFLSRVEYRLLDTATPAPNDFMELGTSSEALGEMGRNQMLGMFFSHTGKATQDWELKGHARKAYWRWVARWARAIRRPSDFGFDDGGFVLPPLSIVNHVVGDGRRTDGRRGLFYFANTLNDQRRERRRTLKERCERVAGLVPRDRPAVIWCHLNDEGDLLERIVPGAVQVAGRHSDELKEERIVAFSTGQVRVLVTKPRISGWGVNWQHCSDVFCFPSHSWESFYQLVRRCWRFGQRNPVTCNVVMTEGERPVMDNMMRKDRQAQRMFDGIIREMHDWQVEPERNGRGEPMEVPGWLCRW